MIDKIEVNTQSSIKINNIYFDPLDIQNGNAEIIFITHPHYDHFSIKDINKIIDDKTILVMPLSMKNIINENYNLENIIFMSPNEEIDINSIHVKSVRAYNTNKPMHKKEYDWLGYIVTINNEKIYVSGDIDDISLLENISCDIACVPIGGTYTMDAYEAANFINNINPKYAIPTHYGTIVGSKDDVNTFKQVVNNKIEVVEKILF